MADNQEEEVQEQGFYDCVDQEQHDPPNEPTEEEIAQITEIFQEATSMDVEPSLASDSGCFEMPQQGEIGNFNILNHSGDVTPFNIHMDETIGNAIGRATGGVRSDRFDFVLKDGTILDPTQSLRQAGVTFENGRTQNGYTFGGEISLVERDSGISSGTSSKGSNASDKTFMAEDAPILIKEEELDEHLDKQLQDIGTVIITGTDGNFREQPVNKNDTVGSLIAALTRTTDNEEFDLIQGQGSRALPRHLTLRDAGISFGSNLRLTERPMNVFIRNGADGKNMTVQARRSDKVRHLKQRFYEQHGVSVDDQRLQFQSKPLEDDHTLASYRIRDNSSVESTYRLRGG